MKINFKELKKVKDGDNLEEIRKGIEELSKISQGFATRLYQDAQAQAQAQQAQGGDSAQGNSANDDVQDAEVVD